ncbi:BglG family transcription antiterminator [Alicyclobacillus acidocaldarius]|uniref:Transcriptional antiterminator, BglG n=1 Tax=Alicyclobacillus acidocaldarius (strain Tc-4-1) TaxID=1048834 RepID=F8IJS2_ALIAT|nr:BglG family transcription antiterminator [Alicyclobacillus acidocaldarius]AEJ42261.1 transcriptional antiterminator, BglG [Alicyclobacillus acidocaldarius subsp. acidocaldarius Tc-4-1]
MANELTDRQKLLLLELVRHSEGVDPSEVARRLDVSRRTLQRDLRAVAGWLRPIRARIESQGGRLCLLASPQELERIEAALGSVNARTAAITPRQRAALLALWLLAEPGPLKLAYLGKVLDAAPASLSGDLNDLAPWLRARHLTLVRRQGFGVLIEGSEVARRETMADIVYEQISPYQLARMTTREGDLSHPVARWLVEFVQEPVLTAVADAVEAVLGAAEPPVEEADRFEVWLYAVIQCLRVARRGLVRGTDLDESARPGDVALAKELLSSVAKATGLPAVSTEPEIRYMARHLAGLRVRLDDDFRLLPSNVTALDLAHRFVRAVEDITRLPFASDHLLVSGLAQHLAPVLDRVRAGLPIRNPLLEEVKARYPDLFSAAESAAHEVFAAHGLRLPDEEIGFLVMHLGASRERRWAEEKWRAVIVCPHGLSSARLLASRVRKELPEISVQEVASAKSAAHVNADLILSTVSLPESGVPAVVVSPFLTEEDLRAIRLALAKMERPARTSFKPGETLTGTSKWASRLASLARTAAIRAETVGEVIRLVGLDLVRQGRASDAESIAEAIERRERLGSVVLPDRQLAVLHARTDGIDGPFVGVYRLERPIWMRGVAEDEPVSVFLVLLAPVHEDPVVIDGLGRISAALVESETLAEALKSADEEEIRRRLYDAMVRQGE